MITDMKSLIEINEQAIHLQYKELGVVNAVRFFKQICLLKIKFML
jgi:hypothetical protein